jgi:hypothetical protein
MKSTPLSAGQSKLARESAEERRKQEAEWNKSTAAPAPLKQSLVPPAFAGAASAPLTGQWAGRSDRINLLDVADREAAALLTPVPAGQQVQERLVGGAVGDAKKVITQQLAAATADLMAEEQEREARAASLERRRLELERQEDKAMAEAGAQWDAQVARCRVLAASNTPTEEIADADRDLVTRIRNQQSLPPRPAKAKGGGKGRGQRAPLPPPDPNAAWPP